MASLSDKDRNALLKLARSAIAAELDKQTPVDRPTEISESLNEKRGCFVTLHKKGVLRGCIGILDPEKSLVVSVEENALNAAFRDPRFPRLKLNELSDIELEISVLSLPEPMDFTDSDDLKTKLKPCVHGVILSQGWHRATFLPQVWEQLPNKEDFLGHLSLKAGLEKTGWRDAGTTIQTYEAEYFSE